ncbi:MAG: hypothetical protein IJK05_01160 [Bacteroidales bacterium]|nr:hypothetical protein [Bacteroidales bacterium]
MAELADNQSQTVSIKTLVEFINSVPGDSRIPLPAVALSDCRRAGRSEREAVAASAAVPERQQDVEDIEAVKAPH